MMTQASQRYHLQNSPAKNKARIELGDKLEELLAQGTESARTEYWQIRAKSKDEKGRIIPENKISDMMYVARMFGKRSKFNLDAVCELSWKTIVSLSMTTRNYAHRMRCADLILEANPAYVRGEPLPEFSITPKSDPVYALMSYDTLFYTDVSIMHAKYRNAYGFELTEVEKTLIALPTPDLSAKNIIARARAKGKESRALSFNPNWADALEEALSESELYPDEDEPPTPLDQDTLHQAYTEENSDALDHYLEVADEPNNISVYNESEQVKDEGYYQRLEGKVEELTKSIRYFADINTASNAFLGQQDIINALQARVNTLETQLEAERQSNNEAQEKLLRINQYFTDIIESTKLLREATDQAYDTIYPQALIEE
jgi:hypothetical protein